jgi:hypothetical protein
VTTTTTQPAPRATRRTRPTAQFTVHVSQQGRWRYNLVLTDNVNGFSWGEWTAWGSRASASRKARRKLTREVIRDEQGQRIRATQYAEWDVTG